MKKNQMETEENGVRTLSCSCVEGLAARISKVSFEVETTKEVADGLKWLCWNAGLKYPEGISDLLNQMVSDRLAKEGR
ncbi:MAG: hypothetical protein MJZ81_09675 [Bacteroidales bacterium]|nr:hypothetical protein [Bacteroidales bacterium]